jgi:hypothetical protein
MNRRQKGILFRIDQPYFATMKNLRLQTDCRRFSLSPSEGEGGGVSAFLSSAVALNLRESSGKPRFAFERARGP